MENDIQALKKALDWELSLETRDLRSHGWYHGIIPRNHAEEIVVKDGDFVIRDCISQPGNFVLTCRTSKNALHFVINKLVQQRDTVYERVQFQLEDDAYDSIADLVRSYVGSGRFISTASKARIQTPCNRTLPLSYYASKYGANSSYGNVRTVELQGSSDGPTTPAKNENSQPTNNNGMEERFKSLKLNPPSWQGRSAKFNSLPRPDQPLSVSSKYTTSSSSSPPPPPKPRNNVNRDLSIDPRYRGITYHHTSGSDSGNGSGDSVHSALASDGAASDGQIRGVIIRNPKYISHSASSITLTNYSDYDAAQMEEYLDKLKFEDNEYSMACQFDLDNYETLLLPVSENKPLDNTALYTFRMMLFENGATMIANHLTRADLMVVLGLNFSADMTTTVAPEPSLHALHDKMNILELITLEQGRQFRLDLIERLQCMKLLVAVTILTCGSDEERAETLNKWIQVATEVKTAYGNLFGFSAIVLGISTPQIQNLSSTWHILRQNFTDNAFLFEAKIRPMWRSMNEGTFSQAPNTTIPYFVPYILIRDLSSEELLELRHNGQCSLFKACLQPWIASSNDDGLAITMNHLELSRSYINNLATFKQNAQIFMQDSSIRHDELLEDAFRTQFHMKFLWGTKGAVSPAQERFSKLEQILTLMTEQFCNNNQ